MADDVRTTPAQIRRYYEHRMSPFSPTSKVKRDVLALLDDRKALQRAGEALLQAAIPYSGDPAVKKAIDDFRALLAGGKP